MPLILSVDLRADLANTGIAANMARTAAEIFAKEHGVSGNIAEFGHAFELSMSEAFNNSVKYGDYGTDDRVVSIELETEADRLIAKVTDGNHSFNPHPPAPDIQSYPDGGFGLIIIGKLMDVVTYERNAGMNILSMTKFAERT